MEGTTTTGEKSGRVPLSDCVKRWFKDTMKEAKAGDINMQVLVGQMYYSGYGVTKDAEKFFVGQLRGIIGLPKHQGLGLQFGKLVISTLVIMQVTLILKNRRRILEKA